jgi:hypothetical protein
MPQRLRLGADFRVAKVSAHLLTFPSSVVSYKAGPYIQPLRLVPTYPAWSGAPTAQRLDLPSESHPRRVCKGGPTGLDSHGFVWRD